MFSSLNMIILVPSLHLLFTLNHIIQVCKLFRGSHFIPHDSVLADQDKSFENSSDPDDSSHPEQVKLKPKPKTNATFAHLCP